MKYYSEVGSYRGCIKVRGKWIGVKDLNYINKDGWHRHQGPPTPAMVAAMKRSCLSACALSQLQVDNKS